MDTQTDRKRAQLRARRKRERAEQDANVAKLQAAFPWLRQRPWR
jgi:hypothetical protein